MLRVFLSLVVVGMVSLAGGGWLHAQDEDGGAVIVINNPTQGGQPILGSGTLNFGSGTGSILPGITTIGGTGAARDGLGLLPVDTLGQLSTLTSWTVSPGTTFNLYLDLAGGGAADVHSFSISLSSMTDMTLDTITTELPSGFTYSYSNGIFSGTNTGGPDISSAEGTLNGNTVYSLTPLAILTFSVDPNAPVGDTLTLPSVAPFSTLTDASGNSIQTGFLSDVAPTIVPAPEPPAFWMMLTGVGGLALLVVSGRLRAARVL